MLEGGQDYAGSVTVGAAAEAHVHWLGVYEADSREHPRWRPIARLA